MCASSAAACMVSSRREASLAGASAKRGLADWRNQRCSALCAGAAPGAELHRAVGDGQAQGRADRALDEADFAAMSPHQLRGDGEPETGPAGAGRALECLEQMLLRFARKARPR